VNAATAGSVPGVRSEFGMVATEDNLIYVFGGQGVAGYNEPIGNPCDIVILKYWSVSQ
jgi:hypothetical protein